MPLSAQGVQGVKDALDSTVKDGFPGLVFSAVDKSGNVLVEHASGTLGVESQDPMSTDSTLFWIASCTKLVTAIAVLQLVEQGKVPLDDGEFVKKILPEIKDKKVYADGVNGADREKEITVSMLLSHTAGFGYSFLDPRIQLQGVSIEGENGDVNDILNGRILNQPGSMWEYGTNIDWAGIILERVTGQSLGDYFAEHIFTPLGITAENATMFPDENAQKNLAKMQQRGDDGTLKARQHLYSAPLTATKEGQSKIFQSGGAGLFSRPKEYVKILAAIINDGTDPKSGKQILKKETVDLLWVNQIPNQPDFARGGITPANLELVNKTPEFYPQPGNPPQGWGFGGFLTIEPGTTGRGKNTLWWMGLANCFWWMDREKGVAGMLAAQVLPNGDPKVIPAWFMAEKAVYDGLS